MNYGSSAQPRPQLGELPGQRLNLSPQQPDLGVLSLNHFTQPGVSRPQRGYHIGIRRDIRHNPLQTTAGTQ